MVADHVLFFDTTRQQNIIFWNDLEIVFEDVYGLENKHFNPFQACTT